MGLGERKPGRQPDVVPDANFHPDRIEQRPGRIPKHFFPIAAGREAAESVAHEQFGIPDDLIDFSRQDREPAPTLPKLPSLPDGAPPWLAGAIDALCECLLAKLPAAIADEIEQRQVTSKGAVVRAPGTCMQPVTSDDVDDRVLGQTIASSIAVGVQTTVLRRVARRAVVLKGVNWSYKVGKGVTNPADPSDQVRVSILVNGQGIGSDPGGGPDQPTAGTRSSGSYSMVPGVLTSGGIEDLAPVTIYLSDGDVVVLCVERVTPPAGQTPIDYFISARWAGWEWTPAMDAQGLDGAVL